MQQRSDFNQAKAFQVRDARRKPNARDKNPASNVKAETVALAFSESGLKGKARFIRVCISRNPRHRCLLHQGGRRRRRYGTVLVDVPYCSSP